MNNKYGIEYLNNVPFGYKEIHGALTTPYGFKIYSNGKSMFSKQYKTIYVRDNNISEEDMEKHYEKKHR